MNNLFFLIKRNSKFIFSFVFLFVCCAMFYKYIQNKQYNNSPIYKGTLFIELGHYQTSRGVQYFFNQLNIKSLVEKEFDNVELTFVNKKFNVAINIFDKNKDNVRNKILNVLDYIKKKEKERFKGVSLNNNNIIKTRLSTPISKISVIKKESIFNNYFIIASFFISLLVSFLLVILKDSIRGNDF